MDNHAFAARHRPSEPAVRRLPGVGFASLDTALRRLRWCAALLLLLMPFGLLAQGSTGVGLAPIQVTDPVNGGQMPGFVFYPATQPIKTATAIGSYNVAAAFGATAKTGARPLVVISHGNGGSNLGHHDLASYLASHGFVVATLEHPGDNFHDQSGVGTSSVLVGRPIQASAVIEALLEDPRWGELIDADRIGMAGFSAGGYTSLLTVGAVPRFDRFIDYCDRHGDHAICALTGQLEAKAASRQQTTAAFMEAQQNDLKR